MPVYEYECPFCNLKVELEQSMSEEHKANCPKCLGECVRVYGSFSFVMSDKKRKKELTGWRKGVW